MPDHVNEPVLLVGAGDMAAGYAAVLAALEAPCTVVGRSVAGCERFAAATGLPAVPGGLDAFLAERATTEVPRQAIVAVDLVELAPVAHRLVAAGVERILLEKPGAMDAAGAAALAARAEQAGCEIRVAYNRRYYASTMRAAEIIEADGGARMVRFELTEWPERVVVPGRDPDVLARWFAVNTSHVVDLAFHLGGAPAELHPIVEGSLPWHPSAASFAGSGRTDTGALFVYSADWDGPGRWGVDVATGQHRLVLCPLEELKVQPRGTVTAEPVDIDDEMDRRFKPGLYRQVEAFVGAGAHRLPTLAQQAETWRRWYDPMATGTPASGASGASATGRG
jgi:predicted dehydrogenase